MTQVAPDRSVLGSKTRHASFLLLAATLAALAVVPDWPHRHLGDPNYWAVAGFLVLALRLLSRPRAPWHPGGPNRRAILAFLVAVPLVYLADWFRFGGSPWELGIQIVGVGLWIFTAFLARRSDAALWLGCVAHGIWDAVHFGRVGFVPEWYAAACMVADVGLGAFVLIHLRPERTVGA